MATFVTLEALLTGEPIEINALNESISDLIVVPQSTLPDGVSAGTYIRFDSGRTLPVRGDIATIEALLSNAGPTPPAGASTELVVTRTASIPLSGHRVVKADGALGVTYCDATVLSDMDLALGLSTGAAGPGGAIDVLLNGEITEPSWSWTPGQKIYVGEAGGLVSVIGVGFAWTQIFGIAETATKIMVRIRPPISLM